VYTVAQKPVFATCFLDNNDAGALNCDTWDKRSLVVLVSFIQSARDVVVQEVRSDRLFLSHCVYTLHYLTLFYEGTVVLKGKSFL
jgi:hypothetical protein